MTEAGQETAEAVVFADITGSTGLFERLGDSAAHALIARVLGALEEMTGQFGGRTIKKIGDEVLSRFPDAGAAVAYAIAGQRQASVRAGGHPVQLCFGVNYGPVVEDGTGDLFGDTVNVAARLRSLASPGQIITTLETLDAAPSPESIESRRLGSYVLTGKSRPVEVMEVLWQRELGNLTMMGPGPRFESGSLGLRLTYEGSLKEIGQAGGEEITLGRESDNSIVVLHDSVSRRHATLMVRNGKFYLKDHSSNGTYVRAGNSDPIVARRESVPLQGHGDISLGVDFDGAPDKLISYEVVRVTR